MADGGASSFIFLATALLVSGGVSAVLISQWGEMATTLDQQRREDEADLKRKWDLQEIYQMWSTIMLYLPMKQ